MAQTLHPMIASLASLRITAVGTTFISGMYLVVTRRVAGLFLFAGSFILEDILVLLKRAHSPRSRRRRTESGECAPHLAACRV